MKKSPNTANGTNANPYPQTASLRRAPRIDERRRVGPVSVALAVAITEDVHLRGR
jgi:hypothetical protein